MAFWDPPPVPHSVSNVKTTAERSYPLAIFAPHEPVIVVVLVIRLWRLTVIAKGPVVTVPFVAAVKAVIAIWIIVLALACVEHQR